MSEQVKLPKPRRWLVMLTALLIFISGLIVGAGGATFVIIRNAQERMRHQERIPPRIVGFLRSRLDLTDEQAAKIEQVLRERQSAFQAIRREVAPRIESELELARDKINEILTPEQRAKWEEIFSSMRRRWSMGRNGDGPRPDRRFHHRPGPPPAATTEPAGTGPVS